MQYKIIFNFIYYVCANLNIEIDLKLKFQSHGFGQYLKFQSQCFGQYFIYINQYCILILWETSANLRWNTCCDCSVLLQILHAFNAQYYVVSSVQQYPNNTGYNMTLWFLGQDRGLWARFLCDPSRIGAIRVGIVTWWTWSGRPAGPKGAAGAAGIPAGRPMADPADVTNGGWVGQIRFRFSDVHPAVISLRSR